MPFLNKGSHVCEEWKRERLRREGKRGRHWQERKKRQGQECIRKRKELIGERKWEKGKGKNNGDTPWWEGADADSNWKNTSSSWKEEKSEWNDWYGKNDWNGWEE